MITDERHGKSSTPSTSAIPFTGCAIAGVDGCRDGWVVVIDAGGMRLALIARNISTLVSALPGGTFIAIDIPIGLPEFGGGRACDRAARRMLKRPRASSVFPVPVRGSLDATSYAEASRLNREITGRGLSVQTWCIMPKICEVDQFIRGAGAHSWRISEVHPEVSFAAWNCGSAMVNRKSTPAGRVERERLIDGEWPGDRERLWESLVGDVRRDDLNDAFAALWTARRARAGIAQTLPATDDRDGFGTRMRIMF